MPIVIKLQQALKSAGFEVLEAEDLAEKSDIPWYQPIDPNRGLTLEQFKTTWLGRNITHYVVWLLEMIGLAPRGTMRVSSFLKKGADGLVAGGKYVESVRAFSKYCFSCALKPFLPPFRREGIYTSMFFTLCRKPYNK